MDVSGLWPIVLGKDVSLYQTNIFGRPCFEALPFGSCKKTVFFFFLNLFSFPKVLFSVLSGVLFKENLEQRKGLNKELYCMAQVSLVEEDNLVQNTFQHR